MWFWILLGYLLVQRLAELAVAERNRTWALERGGRETGKEHYPLIVVTHSLFYVSLVAEFHGLSSGWNPYWPAFAALLLVAQSVRWWAIRSLGRYWNTRIIVIPGSKPVERGPYRFVRHPNYAVVTVEILVIPVLCGAYVTAAVFSAANAALLFRRIREEERALSAVAGEEWASRPRFIPS